MFSARSGTVVSGDEPLLRHDQMERAKPKPIEAAGFAIVVPRNVPLRGPPVRTGGNAPLPSRRAAVEGAAGARKLSGSWLVAGCQFRVVSLRNVPLASAFIRAPSEAKKCRGARRERADGRRIGGTAREIPHLLPPT